MKSTLLGALVLTFAVSSSVAGAARADETAKKPKKEAAKESKDYEYKFDDDPMQAGNNGAYTAQIKVVKMGARNRLIRPRTQFVTELLRSIEQL